MWRDESDLAEQAVAMKLAVRMRAARVRIATGLNGRVEERSVPLNTVAEDSQAFPGFSDDARRCHRGHSIRALLG